MPIQIARKPAAIGSDLAKSARDAILSFLQGCAIPYIPATVDENFYQECYNECVRRKYPVEGKYSVRTYLRQGVAIAFTSYSHLPEAVMVEIALYTACAIYMDDMAGRGGDMEAAYLFNERFVQKRNHGDKNLDAFADSLSKLSQYASRVVYNIIVTSTLNGVTALLVECETQNMLLSRESQNYSNYYRVMSGFSEAYGYLAFPKEIPLVNYIQAMPDLMIFINNTNDILSFYKEEVGGEAVNHVSILAACQGISKIDALRQLVDATVEAHNKILRILEPRSAAYNAYIKFSRGFVDFHIAAEDRYKLDELCLRNGRDLEV
ncbi:terpenoid synthase [Hygrophoropsis aurantiaca]|uniref:Terpenoid synthase n=1 Tax=Hygrophoropsis aurantiaca TaxID=72124 RepID=A0ACB8AHU7_9AGAM|nr:terpenoid synthase [Hygrophoropsis aurantiaca]